MNVFQGPFFELQVPEDWEQEIIENIPAFYDLDAGWVLQIAATSNPGGAAYDPDTQMRTYLEQNGLEYQDDRVMRYQNASGLECLACEFIKDNRFWLVQIIVRGPRMLLIIFNSDETPAAELARDISGAVGSIRFFEPVETPENSN